MSTKQVSRCLDRGRLLALTTHIRFPLLLYFVQSVEQFACGRVEREDPEMSRPGQDQVLQELHRPGNIPRDRLDAFGLVIVEASTKPPITESEDQKSNHGIFIVQTGWM